MKAFWVSDFPCGYLIFRSFFYLMDTYLRRVEEYHIIWFWLLAISINWAIYLNLIWISFIDWCICLVLHVFWFVSLCCATTVGSIQLNLSENFTKLLFKTLSTLHVVILNVGWIFLCLAGICSDLDIGTNEKNSVSQWCHAEKVF